jgi:hypothetical protein
MKSFRIYSRIAASILAITIPLSCKKDITGESFEKGNLHFANREWDAAITDYTK